MAKGQARKVISVNTEQHLEARMSRRIAAQGRYLLRIERREVAAEQMIGELCREGRPVYYVWPVRGKYREGTRSDLVSFLLRNNYA